MTFRRQLKGFLKVFHHRTHSTSVLYYRDVIQERQVIYTGRNPKFPWLGNPLKSVGYVVHISYMVWTFPTLGNFDTSLTFPDTV